MGRRHWSLYAEVPGLMYAIILLRLDYDVIKVACYKLEAPSVETCGKFSSGLGRVVVEVV
jgi:hypothetical protein